MKIKPFIRWAGGKQNQYSQLLQYFPKEKNVNKYYEPFLGGGTMFLNTKYGDCHISDSNRHLINVYQKIQVNPFKLFNHLETYQNGITEHEYYVLRNEFNSKKYNFTYKNAAIFILLNKSSFNGVYRVNMKGEYNVPFGKTKPSLPSMEQLQLVSDRLQSATIDYHSFEEIHDKVQIDDFVYLDPPYPPISDTSSFQHYTKTRFHLNDQERVFCLFESLSERNVRTVLSYPDLPIIRKTYEEYNINELPTFRSVKSKGKQVKIKELVICNF